MDKTDYKEMVGKLLEEQIQLKEKIWTKDEYIKILESKVDKLETDIYFLTRDNKIEEVMRELNEEERNKEIRESLNQMGMTEDDIAELSDLLDEAIDKKDDEDVGNEK